MGKDETQYTFNEDSDYEFENHYDGDDDNNYNDDSEDKDDGDVHDDDKCDISHLFFRAESLWRGTLVKHYGVHFLVQTVHYSSSMVYIY